MAAKRHTPEGDPLDVLTTLVEAREARHYPLDEPDPVAAIRYHMDQHGLVAKDLVPFVEAAAGSMTCSTGNAGSA